MALKIGVSAKKGGDTKTTTAVHLAAGLVRRGDRVLLIDTDSQGDCAKLFGMPPEDGLYHWLVEGAPFADVVRSVPHPAFTNQYIPRRGRFDLIPGASLTYTIAQKAGPYTFAERVAEIEKHYNVIVIDTAPTWSDNDAMVYLVPDSFLFVTRCEPLSLSGLSTSIQSALRFADMRESLGLAPQGFIGIQPNVYVPGTRIHTYLMQELGETYGKLVWPAITRRTVWPEASAFGKAIFAYEDGDPRSTAAAILEIDRMVERVLEAINVGV